MFGKKKKAEFKQLRLTVACLEQNIIDLRYKVKLLERKENERKKANVL